MTKIKYILIGMLFLLVFLLFIVFSINNQEIVNVNYLLGTVAWPLYVVVIVAMVLGLILTTIFWLFAGINMKVHKYKAAKKIKKMEKEVTQLKASSAV